MKPELSHEIELRPAFHDLDPMNVVWHGNYARYLELARCALLSKFNYDYPDMKASGYAWPIVDLRIKYVRPLLLGQRLLVRAEVVEWEHRLRMSYLIKDALSGQRLTQAHSVQVAVLLSTGELQYVCPPILWERLGVTPR